MYPFSGLQLFQRKCEYHRLLGVPDVLNILKVPYVFNLSPYSILLNYLIHYKVFKETLDRIGMEGHPLTSGSSFLTHSFKILLWIARKFCIVEGEREGERERENDLITDSSP